MDAVGRTYAFGNAPALGSVSVLAGRPLYRKLHASANGWYAVAAYGKVIGFGPGYVQADWAGWIDYGSWNVISDVALINPVDPGSPGQPLSGSAAQSFVSAAYARY